MERDLIGELGFLTLGSRFRRLGERLQAGVALASRKLDLTVAPAHYPLLVALDERPRTIGGLVARLDIAQPGITRSVTKLIGDGLIEPVSGEHEATETPDGRQRRLRLSRRGRAVLARARAELLPLIEREVAAICGADGASLLAGLDRLDDALRAEPLDVRIGGAAQPSATAPAAP